MDDLDLNEIDKHALDDEPIFSKAQIEEIKRIVNNIVNPTFKYIFNKYKRR